MKAVYKWCPMCGEVTKQKLVEEDIYFCTQCRTEFSVCECKGYDKKNVKKDLFLL